MAQDDELPRKKKGKSKLLLLFFFLLFLGGGGAAYYLGLLDQWLPSWLLLRDGVEESPRQSQTAQAPAVKTSSFALPGFVVNLFDPLGRRYIKLDMELELISPEVSKEIQAQNARIRDSMIMLLSSKTFNELSTQEGKHILRNEILDRLNQVLGGPKVVRVFFTDLVIQ